MINPNPTSSDPLFVVVGATGAQGGSVISALEASTKSYRVRGLARDATKPAAQALAKRGVEVYPIDLYAAPPEELGRSFEGATYLFLVTQFDPTVQDGYAKELADGKSLFGAAAALSPPPALVVFSSLTHLGRATGGKYTRAANFDSKGDVAEYAKSAYPELPFAEVQCGSYMEMFQTVWRPHPAREGGEGYGIALPTSGETELPIIWTGDYGRYVRGLVESSGRQAGAIVYTGRLVSLESIAKELSKAMGKEVRFRSDDRTVPFFLDACRAIQMVGYYNGGNPADSAEYLDGPLRTFAEWAAQVDWEKVLQPASGA